jgi:AcrR family transcriptional regulator
MERDLVKTAYHHGDLRNALVSAAAELAETGGPDAVTIRAAARAVGVTPTASYRHFADRDELLNAARDECLERMAGRLLARVGDVPEDLPLAERALQRFLASGRAYFEFGLEEPGLFRTCFCIEPEADDGLTPQDTAPYQLLSGLLDEMVEARAMDSAERPLAEALCWSTVHGLALLVIDGPLGKLAPEELDETVELTLRRIARGLGAPLDLLG